jgi:hypothetical protein
VTEEILYDRMKNVFIRKIAGKNQFNDTLVRGFPSSRALTSSTLPFSPNWIAEGDVPF